MGDGERLGDTWRGAAHFELREALPGGVGGDARKVVPSTEAEKAWDVEFLARMEELETRLDRARAELRDCRNGCGRKAISRLVPGLAQCVTRCQADADAWLGDGASGLRGITDREMARRVVGSVPGNTHPGQVKSFVGDTFRGIDVACLRDGGNKEWEIRDMTGHTRESMQKSWVFVDGAVLASITKAVMYPSVLAAIHSVEGFVQARLGDATEMMIRFRKDKTEIVGSVTRIGDAEVKGCLRRVEAYRALEARALAPGANGAHQGWLARTRNRMLGDLLTVLLAHAGYKRPKKKKRTPGKKKRKREEEKEEEEDMCGEGMMSGGDRRRGRRTNDATSEGVGEAGRRESQPNRGGATRRVRVEAGASPGAAEASEEGARGTGSTRWVMAYKVEVVWPMVHQSMRANMRRAVRLHATSRSIGAPPYVAEEQRPREG